MCKLHIHGLSLISLASLNEHLHELKGFSPGCSGGSVCLLLQKCVEQHMVKDLEATSLGLESHLAGLLFHLLYIYMCWKMNSMQEIQRSLGLLTLNLAVM